MTASHDIRSAQLTDAAEIARLSAELGYPCSAIEMHRRLAILLADPHHAVLVASSGKRLLGWLGLEHRISLEGGDEAEIVGFVVDAGARRSGIGRGLLDAAEAWAQARSFDRLRVRSNVTRLESHPFYGKHGFTRCKTQHVYVKPLQILE